MAKIHTKILSNSDIQTIHGASLAILKKTGIMIHHDEVLKLVGQAGAKVNKDSKIARLPEQLVMDCIAKATKQYILHGRDLKCTARFGYGDLVLMSSPGQY
ncbi:MAG: trimethylamine methyltransferase family protein, partial [Planctomycetota bacterium]